jgi:hypothetical protein
MPRQWQHQPRHLPLSRFRMKYFSACGSSFDLLCSFWFSEVDEGLYFVAEFRTDYSFDNEFIEKSINRLASFTNLLADD